VPLDEFAEHMRALVARIRAKTKARVYLVAFNPISDAYQAQEWSAAVRERQRAVYGTYRERTIALGRELAAPVVDVYPLFEPSPAALLLPDGIHPNRDGMAVYARALERQLAKDLGRR
jgi:lysophospholipase L1-like esterase